MNNRGTNSIVEPEFGYRLPLSSTFRTPLLIRPCRKPWMRGSAAQRIPPLFFHDYIFLGLRFPFRPPLRSLTPIFLFLLFNMSSRLHVPPLPASCVHQAHWAG